MLPHLEMTAKLPVSERYLFLTVAGQASALPDGLLKKDLGLAAADTWAVDSAESGASPRRVWRRGRRRKGCVVGN
jgi:hypothetical protein